MGLISRSQQWNSGCEQAYAPLGHSLILGLFKCCSQRIMLCHKVQEQKQLLYGHNFPVLLNCYKLRIFSHFLAVHQGISAMWTLMILISETYCWLWMASSGNSALLNNFLVAVIVILTKHVDQYVFDTSRCKYNNNNRLTAFVPGQPG